MLDLILEAKDASDWSYRGEGAANLVLSYNGSTPDLVGKVIRVQKVPIDGSEHVDGNEVLSKHEQLLWEDYGAMVKASTKEIANHLYLQCVIIPLLGSEFVDAGRRVVVSREFLESVERNVLNQRPNWRVLESKVNASCDSALMMADHSVFPNGDGNAEPCLCVEMKPKCGFLPSSRFISEKNAIKRNVARFKMHQAFKLQKHQISELSEYDPLDLFSGTKDGIHKAVRALFATPQNNLRVFLDGSLVYGSLGGGMNGTTYLSTEKFEDSIKCFLQANDGFHMSTFEHLAAETIYELGVMDRLLRVQKVDNLDIEGAIHAYYDLTSQPCMACKDLEEDQRPRYASLHTISKEESTSIVRNHLISATAKDCSLMVCFRPKKDDDLQSVYGNIYLESTGQRFDYKAFFIDLDLKPLEKMEYYYELDQKIVRNYNQVRGASNGAAKPSTRCRH